MVWYFTLLSIVFALVALFCFLWMFLRTYSLVKDKIRPVVRYPNKGIGGFLVFMIVFFASLILSWIFVSL